MLKLIADPWITPVMVIGSTPSGTLSAGQIILMAKSYDSHSAYNVSTGLFTVVSGMQGLYMLFSTIQVWRFAQGGALSTEWKLNGTTLGRQFARASGPFLNSELIAVGNRQKYLNVGDQVGLYINQVDSGMGYDTGDFSNFCIVRLPVNI